MKNVVDPSAKTTNDVEYQRVSLAEAKTMFLREVRGLAKQTQRWHRENLTALENVLARQDIVIDDVTKLTTSFVKNRFVFYILEDLGLKPNTINGRIRTLKSFSTYLHKEGIIEKDFAVDLQLIKAEKVSIQTFSEEQIERLLRQPDRKTFTGLRDFTLLLLLLETGIRISECEHFSRRRKDARRPYLDTWKRREAETGTVPVQISKGTSRVLEIAWTG